jgi:phenylalanyl-tRNA synthetase alpha chain
MQKFEQVRDDFEKAISSISSLDQLESIKVEFLGKKGKITGMMSHIATLSPEEKKAFGQEVNRLKELVSNNIEQKKQEIEEKVLAQRLSSEKIDVSLPARSYAFGKVHPISQAIADLTKIFTNMGFALTDGPDIENEWNNFAALNIPDHHPARQMQDTFYIKDNDFLLRTHTSSVQIRHMSTNKPPIKIISLGKVYRSDMDATHTPMFHQIEGLYIDKNITMAHLKAYLEQFLKEFFEIDQAPIRLRPSYFPFTEPSAEVDIKCDRSSKGEIKLGVGSDWLEVLGCGMVHPNVLSNVGIDPEQYQGFAFGAGIERLTMLKYNIPDLRTFFEGDIRWNRYYGLT